MCVTCPGEAPGATGWVNGGSQLELPVKVKKLVHCAAVTRLSVSTVGLAVGGVVVEGSHCAIWSARELASGTKEMTEPFGTSEATAGLMLTVVAATLSTVVPGAMPVPKTDMPDLVARQVGQSRLVYFAGDIERTAWQSGNTDLSILLRNSIRWASKGEAPLKIEGTGLIETFAWETEAGYALHVLNYTNPGAFKGWIREYYPIGEQRVTMAIPQERHV